MGDFGLIRGYPEEFERWWRSWPRKVAKLEAAKAWAQTAGIRPPVDVLIEITRMHDQVWTARGVNAEHIPHPSRWLRGARWEDELIWHTVVGDGQRVSQWWSPQALLTGEATEED